MRSNVVVRMFTALNHKIWFRGALALTSIIVPLLFVFNGEVFKTVDSVLNIIYGNFGGSGEGIILIFMFTSLFIALSFLILIVLSYLVLFAILNFVIHPKTIKI